MESDRFSYMSESPVSSDDPTRLSDRAQRRRVSGKVAALWLVFCLLLTALLIPTVFKLPRWIEFEIVLGIWWVIWLSVLTWFLYRGVRVTDDHTLPQPRNWFSLNRSNPGQATGPNGCLGDGCFPAWVIGDELAFLIVAVIVLVGGLWLLIEVAIPVLLFMLYFAARGMLARVVNVDTQNRGHIGSSLFWGLVWATLYTLPLVGAVWFIHYVHKRG
jgi:hypothetical protein